MWYQWENINHTTIFLSLIVEYLAGIPFVSKNLELELTVQEIFVKVLHYSTNERWKRIRSSHWFSCISFFFSCISFYTATSWWFIAFAHIWNNFNNYIHNTSKTEHKYFQYASKRSVSCFKISINSYFQLNIVGETFVGIKTMFSYLAEFFLWQM